MKLEKLRDIIGRRSKNRFSVPKSEDDCNHVVALSSDDDIVAYIALSNCADALLDVVEAVKYIASMNCPKNPETALGRSLRSAIDTCSETLARLEAVE